MNAYLLILRFFHVVGGVFWAGATFFVVAFALPAVRLAGPGGQDFMRALTQRTRYSLAMGVAGGLTVITGILLYLHDSATFRSGWMMSGMGVTLSIGGLAGIAALVVGGAVISTASARAGALGEEIAAGGGPPTPEQAAQMGALQARIVRGTQWNAALIAVAVIAMGVARYVR
jgi:uncharacterized membrane protein